MTAPVSSRLRSRRRPLIAILTCALAALTIPSSSPGNLINISTRLEVLTGNQAAIGGFIVFGASNKGVLVRVLGPTLTDFGVTGVLADPVLALHHRDEQGRDSIIGTNDDWKTSQEAAITATGKAPPKDVESAILAELAPGSFAAKNRANYSAVVTGKNNTTGVALVEAYDVESNSSVLFNISTRGFVDVGDKVMIGGFITAGNSTPVIVRALGPTLSQFGVRGVVADPTLELRDANGVLLAANDDWTTSPQRTAIQDSGYAPPNAKEPAIMITRPAANTTAIVRGKNNTTGAALVEVYDLTPYVFLP